MLQMPQLRKIRSSLLSAGRYAKERENRLCSDSSINEQYRRAHRTESYVRIYDIVQDQLGKQSTLKLSSAPSKSRSSHLHLSQNLLSPRQVTEWIKTLDLHPLIVDYFEDSLETCRVCELLVLSVHQTRANNRPIKRAIKLTKKLHDATSNTDHQCQLICEELSAFSQHTNPFYLVSKEKIHNVYQAFAMLRQKLKAKHKKTMLRVKLKRIANSILMGLMGCTLGLHKKRTKLVQGNPKMTRQEVLGAQLDEAVRGLFILIKHIDTISVVAGSLYAKVENMKELANMCVQSGKSKMLKEVVKEFNYHNTGFLEQLEELENLACLCLRDINVSRRSIMKEIMVPQQGR